MLPHMHVIGITSACAEQTLASGFGSVHRWDHLRVCGADCHLFAFPACGLGSPPRVRSRRAEAERYWYRHGITSACAEQTRGRRWWPASPGDHLRVCGADLNGEAADPKAAGSPPRVRSRLDRVRDVLAQFGITSACAEQTSTARLRTQKRRDHLRVCGADLIASEMFSRSSGSPPRVRSRPGRAAPTPSDAGITSACAEQTECADAVGDVVRDHLRVCGADSHAPFVEGDYPGSPPRVRSRLGDG